MQITLTQEQYKKLMTCKDLAAASLLSEYNDTSIAAVLDFLAAQYLKTKRPSEKNDMRGVYTNSDTNTESNDPKLSDNSHKNLAHLSRKNIQTETESDSAEKPVSILKFPYLSKIKKENQTLTPKTRKLVLQKDGCCQYKDPLSGKICGSTFNLEVDHKQPRWADGSHALDNLQALCKGHNNLKYKKEMNLRLF